MSLPKSVKFTKNGVEYLSNCDRLQYTIKELTRAALRDTGKYICKMTRKKVRRRTGRLAKNTQYWVRSKQETPDLQVGFKPGGFYGLYQEIGTIKYKKIAALSDSTESGVSEIQKIQQQYLSAVGTESAESMIDEGEYQGE
ncbi:MAG: HK97 gp10 family phage protein [Ruminococcus sp.]